ncbi:ufm1-specific protease 1 isoform X1 [Syngnathus scovelli]|uniref:ufm1-specific protease 1 isoform X1 n=2 Tax=Syngnathus scovelli TaxID=161590 RepID=UPI0021108BBE|nr:inactive Ufm1-specific protease 1 isoform X1 [Syngnathus scovelli]XP_049588592.1 inactive Ufm1-specific protease 1 isoform X1 [Syngnathus scovelli]XP_049588600.1 inactive Ufm1-specific protease 1 isoform X1 [Syngnathus scovelli]XP_049588608.1 inactive Ufm1-specific protease 1 isoform X1 [Syngnathus scovelli]
MEIDWGGSATGNVNVMTKVTTLLTNVHTDLPLPIAEPLKTSLVEGDYQYYHYGCDGQDDRGWGCGYRTIQSMASWLGSNVKPQVQNKPPPSILEIQQALVSMMDKPSSFLGSKEWIGTFEASLVLSYFYDVPCRLVHVRSGGAELEQVAVETLHRHFSKHRCPVMMGGDRDNSSKGVMGVCTGAAGSYLLIVDPHYYGGQLERGEVQRRGWAAWKKLSSFNQSSFYNLCLPQIGGSIS